MGRVAAFTALCYVLMCLSGAAPLQAQWELNGTKICTESNYQNEPAITADGYGGAIIVWSDNRNWSMTEYDLYAQRIDAYGNVLWTPEGVVVSDADMDQTEPRICSDGAGAR